MIKAEKIEPGDRFEGPGTGYVVLRVDNFTHEGQTMVKATVEHADGGQGERYWHSRDDVPLTRG